MNNDLKYVGKQFGLVILVLLLAVLVFAIGLALGYGSFGSGDNPWAILSMDKWHSIISKFTGQ